MRQKRVAAIHDISCFGKCSLTVALPILSAAGLEACPVPTSVLSTHTGGFSGVHIRDLTADILPTAEHWRGLGLHFDALYSGYLGSREQLDIVASVFDMLAGGDTLIIVDPVMADHGRLYGGFDDNFPEGMAKLCGRADIITPNITEAAFMLGEPYREGPYSAEYIEKLLERLYERVGMKRGTIVLTGVHYGSELLGAASYSPANGMDTVFSQWYKGAFHGTGDIFTSVLTGGLMRGLDIRGAMQAAADYVAECVRLTSEGFTYMTYGVNFEAGLSGLAERLDRYKQK